MGHLAWRAPWTAKGQRGLLALALTVGAPLVLLVPIWAFRCFPSQDGPAHVYNASLLLSLLQGKGDELRAFYEWNLEPFPNWFSHASLAALMTVFSPPAAEKVLLSLYALCLPLSFRYALAAVRPRAAELAWLSLPFVLNRYVHEGFYNRAFALVPFFLALGYYIRRRGVLGWVETAALSALVLWVYFCTAGSVLVLILNLGLLALAFALDDSPDAASGLWPAIRRRLRGLAALAPAAALLVRFQLDQRPTTSGAGPGWQERARYLANLYDVIAYDRMEAWIAGVFALALGVALVWVALLRVRERGWRWQDVLLVLAVAVAALYFTAPQVSIPGVRSEPIHYRFSLHVLLAFLLWLAAELRSRPGRLLVGASLLAALGLTAVRFPYYARFDDLLAEQTSVAPFIPRGATFLALSFDHEGDGGAARPLPPAWVMGPLRHAADLLAVSRDLLAMDNYQADTRHFPLRFRAGANPHELLQTRLDGMPGCVRIGRFNRRAPRPIEYILIWRRELAPSDRCTRSTLRHVETHYRRIRVSAPRGFGEVFQRRQPSGS